MPPRKTGSSARDGREVSDLRHLLTAGGLVAATLGTLLLGAALQVDPQSAALERATVITARPQIAPPELPGVGRDAQGSPPVAGGSLAAPEPTSALPPPSSKAAAPVPPPRVAAVSLEDRADDPRRMLNGGNAWTLKFMVACDHERTERLLRAVDDDPRLFLLPVTVKDRPCHRICWNTYRTRELALADSDVPAALWAVNAEPIARKVTDLIP